MRGSSVVALVLVAAASAASGPFACVHASDAFGRGLKFFESFEGKGLNAWIQSSDTMYNGELKMKDGGFVVPEAARRYGASSAMPSDVVPGKDTIVLQYDVKFSKGHSCAGGYLKFLSSDPAFSASTMNEKTPYSVMFGPDKCGPSNKVHLIIRYKNQKTGEVEEKHLRSPPEVPPGLDTHVYTAILSPDNTYKVLVDDKVAKEGSLFEDFDPPFLPPAEIDDPEDEKPDDWVDEAKIPDPDAVKPADWDDDAPRMIPDVDATMPSDWELDTPLEIVDPEAEMPEEWDEDEDGEWEAPVVPNPHCAKISGCGPWNPPEVRRESQPAHPPTHAHTPTCAACNVPCAAWRPGLTHALSLFLSFFSFSLHPSLFLFLSRPRVCACVRVRVCAC